MYDCSVCFHFQYTQPTQALCPVCGEGAMHFTEERQCGGCGAPLGPSGAVRFAPKAQPILLRQASLRQHPRDRARGGASRRAPSPAPARPHCPDCGSDQIYPASFPPGHRGDVDRWIAMESFVQPNSKEMVNLRQAIVDHAEAVERLRIEANRQALLTELLIVLAPLPPAHAPPPAAQPPAPSGGDPGGSQPAPGGGGGGISPRRSSSASSLSGVQPGPSQPVVFPPVPTVPPAPPPGGRPSGGPSVTLRRGTTYELSPSLSDTQLIIQASAYARAVRALEERKGGRAPALSGAEETALSLHDLNVVLLSVGLSGVGATDTGPQSPYNQFGSAVAAAGLGLDGMAALATIAHLTTTLTLRDLREGNLNQETARSLFNLAVSGTRIGLRSHELVVRGAQGAAGSFVNTAVPAALAGFDVGLGLIATGLATREALRAHTLGQRMNILMQHDKFRRAREAIPAFNHLATQMQGRLGRRRTRAVAGVVGGTFSTLAGGAGIAVAAGAAATVWNPAGWTLAGTAVLIGGGIAARKTYRWMQTRQELERLRGNQAEASPHSLFDRAEPILQTFSTVGDWFRWEIAELAYVTALEHKYQISKLSKPQRDLGEILVWLLFGRAGHDLDLDEACEQVLTHEIGGILNFLKG